MVYLKTNMIIIINYFEVIQGHHRHIDLAV